MSCKILSSKASMKWNQSCVAIIWFENEFYFSCHPYVCASWISVLVNQIEFLDGWEWKVSSGGCLREGFSFYLFDRKMVKKGAWCTKLPLRTWFEEAKDRTTWVYCTQSMYVRGCFNSFCINLNRTQILSGENKVNNIKRSLHLVWMVITYRFIMYRIILMNTMFESIVLFLVII